MSSKKPTKSKALSQPAVRSVAKRDEPMTTFAMIQQLSNLGRGYNHTGMHEEERTMIVREATRASRIATDSHTRYLVIDGGNNIPAWNYESPAVAVSPLFLSLGSALRWRHHNPERQRFSILRVRLVIDGIVFGADRESSITTDEEIDRIPMLGEQQAV